MTPFPGEGDSHNLFSTSHKATRRTYFYDVTPTPNEILRMPIDLSARSVDVVNTELGVFPLPFMHASKHQQCIETYYPLVRMKDGPKIVNCVTYGVAVYETGLPHTFLELSYLNQNGFSYPDHARFSDNAYSARASVIKLSSKLEEKYRQTLQGLSHYRQIEP